MELTHRFTVPASVETTWAAFEDIESVAGCFPGAVVTEVDGDDFRGSCKVKLGPIALVYNGTGTFVEKDREAGTFVVEAKGKDKRGNGTAGATVRASLAEAPGAAAPTASTASTEVTVVTDLAITGKPAQFGRGVIEDVSNKLLGQFVACLEQRVGVPDTEPEAGTPAAAGAGEPEAGAAAGAPEAGAAGAGSAEAGGAAGGAASTGEGPSRPPTDGVPPRAASREGSEDALDLGAAVLPILLRTYWKQGLAAVVAVAVLIRVLRRRR